MYIYPFSFHRNVKRDSWIFMHKPETHFPVGSFRHASILVIIRCKADIKILCGVLLINSCNPNGMLVVVSIKIFTFFSISTSSFMYCNWKGISELSVGSYIRSFFYVFQAEIKPENLLNYRLFSLLAIILRWGPWICGPKARASM